MRVTQDWFLMAIFFPQNRLPPLNNSVDHSVMLYTIFSNANALAYAIHIP